METATDGLWAFLSETVSLAAAHHKAHLCCQTFPGEHITIGMWIINDE